MVRFTAAGAVTLRISHTALSDFQLCQRYYAYRHVERMERVGTGGINRALAMGRAGHKGQEALWSWEGDPADPARTTAAIKAFLDAAALEGLSMEDTVLGQVLLIGYAARYDDLRLMYHMAPLVERRVTVPLLEPSGNPSPDLEVVGVFDVVAYDMEGRTIPVEHKFTSSPIEPGAPYWGRLDMNLQASMYWIIASDAGREVGHILWDAIRAPEMKRYAATPLNKREFYVRDYKHKDGRVSRAGEPKPGIRLDDETAEQFTQRVMAKVLAEPLAFYGRQEVYRDEGELGRVRLDLYQTARAMQHATEERLFPRNLQSCNAYNRPCPYLPVCRGEASIDDPRLYQLRPRRTEEEKVFY